MEELTTNHYRALTLLVAGYSLEEVAEKTDVSVRTIQRWKKRPDFQRLLTESVGKTFDAAVAELVAGSIDAAQELKQIIKDSDVPVRVRVTAISVLLANAWKAKDAILEQRLQRVEDLLDGIESSEAQAD